MDRAQKAELVAEMAERLGGTGVVVVTRNLGMTVAQSTDLRVRMRDAGATYKVMKNNLAKLAIADTAFAGLAEYLTGPTALALSTDPVAAAKIAVDYARTNDRFEVVGGAMAGQLLDMAGVQALATLPSLDELRAKIIGLVQAPATKVVQLVQAPAAQLARVLQAYADKQAA